MQKLFFLALILMCFVTNGYGQYSSVLAQGSWYKIATNKSGIYKLSYNSIQSLGVSMNNLQISDLKLYANGGGMSPQLNSDFRHDDLVENAIKIHDSNSNGIFESADYILFYGESPHVWNYDVSKGFFSHKIHLFSDKVNYFLTVNNKGYGKRVEVGQALQNATKIVTSFNDFSFHEAENENLIQSGKAWFGERFDIQNNQSFNFNFPNLDQLTPLSIKTAVAALASVLVYVFVLH